jgi:LytS/YehU family sensor histidine kinase
MRYMLQDSREEKVNLDKEVEYLKSFIELQRIRLPESVNIIFTIEGNPELYTLEPLLLIPFVENAFKHGISYQVVTDIVIHLLVNDQQLVLNVTNNIFRMGSENIESGSGIGLKNVVRRLELLYPSSHTLTMDDDGHRYQTELSITFSR